METHGQGSKPGKYIMSNWIMRLEHIMVNAWKDFTLNSETQRIYKKGKLIKN